MKSHPLVSVVTPSFNQARFLMETLRSVELQDYRPIQQIVIDGGSSDGSVELLRKWEAADHGPGYSIDWISEPDRGHVDAVNKGFDRSRGEIVGWLNSDDVYFDRHTVKTSVAAMESRPDVDLVFGDVALISEDSGLQMIWCFPPFDYQRALRGYFISQPTVFVRRSITDRYRLDPAYPMAGDLRYWLLIGKDHKFLKIPRVQAGDRDHQGRLTTTAHTEVFDTARKAAASSGLGQKPNRSVLVADGVWKVLLRIRGLIHVLSLTARRNSLGQLAFPAWIDSFANLVKRQLTMRIYPRASMGRRRPAGRRKPQTKGALPEIGSALKDEAGCPKAECGIAAARDGEQD